MSSETITRNDLMNILNEVLPPTPSEYKKLLWTNPSPTSSFAPQTISIDLSDYDEVEIEFKHASLSDSYLYQKARVGSTDVGLFYISAKNGTPIEVEGRPITVSNTGIVFSDGSRAYNTLTASTDNIRCVPTKIYGIKYERVAAPQVDASDYVIEQGTNANGSYRKWNSGTMEQWWLEASASASAHNVSFPEAFISTAYIVVCSNTSGVQANFMPSSTNVAYFTVYPTASVQLFWIAIGRWK